MQEPTAKMLKCPKCPGTMRTYERQGVQIEQCDTCRGIFLDFGELESLGRLEAQLHQPPPQAPQQPQQPQYPQQQYAPPPPQYQQPYPPQGPAWGGHGGHHGGHYRQRGWGGLFFSS
jgi:Zn-finger nucleic acid-binding protein